ncbi:hypothetical protein [Brevundimonas aurantiaca]|uniref:hypothetical protein n=1 Tax=Brevundimonas aurantiaca TaxID=74316 RepID=UPI001749E758|nr:hypothetical protein [Brevundimonas aurantiaca]
MNVFGKKTLILAGLLALSVAGCGRMADLESPRRETERAPQQPRPSLPEPATINRPSSSVPIDGGPSNPFGANPAANDPR